MSSLRSADAVRCAAYAQSRRSSGHADAHMLCAALIRYKSQSGRSSMMRAAASVAAVRASSMLVKLLGDVKVADSCMAAVANARLRHDEILPLWR